MGFGVPRSRDCVFPRVVPVIFATRDPPHSARCVGRVTAGRGRSSAATGEAGELKALEQFFEGLGVLVLRSAREPHFLPGCRVLPAQHQRQSWVSALAACARRFCARHRGNRRLPTWQAHITFAIARHAAVDLAQVLRVSQTLQPVRLSQEDLEHLRRQRKMPGSSRRSPEADARWLSCAGRTNRSLWAWPFAVMPVPPWCVLVP